MISRVEEEFLEEINRTLRESAEMRREIQEKDSDD
jgi:hypothetical protein